MSGSASRAPKREVDRRLLSQVIESSVAFALAALLVARAVVGCGGTTGQDDLSATAGAGDASELDSATDATLDATSGMGAAQDAGAIAVAFDATIEYADADRLPKLAPGATLEAGADAPEAAAPAWMTWPTCACDSVTMIDGVSVGIPVRDRVDPAAGVRQLLPPDVGLGQRA
jgi:hypothetical protein